MTDEDASLAANATYRHAFGATDFAGMFGAWADGDVACGHPGRPSLIGRETISQYTRFSRWNLAPALHDPRARRPSKPRWTRQGSPIPQGAKGSATPSHPTRRRRSPTRLERPSSSGQVDPSCCRSFRSGFSPSDWRLPSVQRTTPMRSTRPNKSNNWIRNQPHTR
jgi:hypothetical protein